MMYLSPPSKRLEESEDTILTQHKINLACIPDNLISLPPFDVSPGGDDDGRHVGYQPSVVDVSSASSTSPSERHSKRHF